MSMSRLVQILLILLGAIATCVFLTIVPPARFKARLNKCVMNCRRQKNVARLST